MMASHNITGIILAGGKSSRMGSDKGLLTFGDVSFTQLIIDTMKPLVNEISIISNDKLYDQFGFPRYEDKIKDAGPLAGLYTGLSYSETEYNLVLSCDVPLINKDVLEVLIEAMDDTFEVILIKSQNRIMPLIGIYKKDCQNKCLELLQTGERRLLTAIEQFKTKTIELDSSLDPFVKNINTQAQFKALQDGVTH